MNDRAPDATIAAPTVVMNGSRSPGNRAPLADAGLMLVSIVWGSSYAAMQVIGRYLTVSEFLALRFLFAIAILAAVYHRAIASITRREAALGLVFGTLLFSILALETLGVRYTSATNAGFLITVSVVVVPVFERVIGRIRHGAAVYGCVLIAFAGCVLLGLPDGAHLTLATGDIIILGAAMIRGFQIFLFGHSTSGRPLSVVNITLVELALVAVLGTIGAAAGGFPALARPGDIPGEVWLLTAYLGVLGTAYAFLVQLYAARLTSPTRVALILSTEPAFAALFGWAAMDNRITPSQALGGLLIFLAAIVGRTLEARRETADG